MVINELGLTIDLTKWQTYVTVILGILMGLGIISNPENGKGYFNAKIQQPISEKSKLEIPKIKSATDSTEPNASNNLTLHSWNSSPEEKIFHDRRHTP